MPSPIANLRIRDGTRRGNGRRGVGFDFAKWAVVAICGTAVLAAGGVWLFHSTAAPDSASSLSKVDRTSGNLQQIKKIRDDKMHQAQLAVAEGASSYLAAWEKLSSLKRTYDADLDIFKKKRASTGPESLPAEIFLVKPRFPLDQIESCLGDLPAARNAYWKVRQQYDREFDSIQKEFDRQLIALLSRKPSPEDQVAIAPDPIDERLDRQIRAADGFLQQHDQKVADFVRNFNP